MQREPETDRETCLQCGGKMGYLGQERLQKGKFSFFFGAWDNLFSGALAVDIYCCHQCRRFEFYAVEAQEEYGNGIAQVPCPGCGQPHDLDDAKCPHCGRRLLD